MPGNCPHQGCLPQSLHVEEQIGHHPQIIKSWDREALGTEGCHPDGSRL